MKKEKSKAGLSIKESGWLNQKNKYTLLYGEVSKLNIAQSKI